MWTLHKLAARKVLETPVDDGDVQEGAAPRLGVKRQRTSVRSGQSEDALRQRDAELQVTPSRDGGRSPLPDHARMKVDTADEKITPGPWSFTEEECERYPGLRKRNFWCIQRHSATAMHYDLRMQVDGGTVSWAVPKGLIGISKYGESSRMAVETTVHPISYTTYEGADGRNFSAGRKGGTLLWDIGTYTITRPFDEESSSEEGATLRRKRRHRSPDHPDSDDLDGRYQEDLFRQGLYRPVGYGKSRSIHFALRGGRKMTDHHFILILSASSKTAALSSNGKVKKTWFLRLPKGVDEYPWDRGGEEEGHWGVSVKTGRTLKQVCAGYTARPERWKCEEERFKSWFGDED
ncbi:DNA ligase D, 3'-phosphoesterase domain-containing protein [Kwoniella sp. DSM 27419]